jgi:P pilus assembly chaperone PapD
MMRRLAMLTVTALVAVTSSLVAVTPADAARVVQFTRIQYDSPGSDTGSNASLNREYVQVKNGTTRTVNLYRWYVRSARTGDVYRFASNFYLRPGATVTIRTGKGTNTATTRYWGRTRYVWNNTRDTAYLRTSSGALRYSCSWTRTGPGYKYC